MKRTRKKRRLKGAGLIMIVVLSLCVAVGIKKSELNQQLAENEMQIEELQQQISEEKSRAKELEEREKYMQTKAYVEDVAHEKLNLVYPDEIFIKPSGN